jgi:hypothetical protein
MSRAALMRQIVEPMAAYFDDVEDEELEDPDDEAVHVDDLDDRERRKLLRQIQRGTDGPFDLSDMSDRELRTLYRQLRQRAGRSEQRENEQWEREAQERSTPRRHQNVHITAHFLDNDELSVAFAEGRPLTDAELAATLRLNYGEMGAKAAELLSSGSVGFREIDPASTYNPVGLYGHRDYSDVDHRPYRYDGQQSHTERPFRTEKELDLALESLGPMGKKALELKRQKRREAMEARR